jgi:hypothetical protein
MVATFIYLHSILRWIILLLCLVVLVRSFMGMQQKNQFLPLDNKLSLYLLIACHTMLILGILQYFLGANGFHLFSTNPVSVVMKTKSLRFFAIEHTIVNILGIAIITMGRIASKKALLDSQKHRKLFIFTAIGLLLILSRIPWPGMAEVGRGWW